MQSGLRVSLVILALLAAGSRGLSQAPAAPATQAKEFAKSEPYIERMRKQGEVLELSFKDALLRALTHNLRIRIENYNQALSAERIRQARGYYDPALSFSTGINSNKNPVSGSGLSLGAGITSVSKFGPSLSQYLPGGGSFSLGLSNNRSFDKTSTLLVNPTFNSSLRFSFTQPLLRGGFFQTAITRQLRILNLDARITESQFRQTVSEVVQAVQNQYWELVYAVENYETQRQSRGLALAQYETTRQKVIVGLLTPVALTSARTEVAIRDQATIQAEVQIINAQNGLKRLLAPDPKDPIWNPTLIPVDQPRILELKGTLEEAIQTAIIRRPELLQIDLQLAQNAVDEEYLKRQTRPALNLTTALTSLGYAGKILDPTTGLPVTQHAAFGGYGTSWKQVFGFDFFSWGFGLDIQIPLRNRTALAELAQNQIGQKKLQGQLKNSQQSVIVEVRNAYQVIEVQKKNLEAARLARQLSQEQLEGETARFEAGFTTNFEVQRYQRDLADAKVRELRALIDYQEAVSALQKATDQIIDANDIVIARGK
jgi:outer membrane protein TolC